MRHATAEPAERLAAVAAASRAGASGPDAWREWGRGDGSGDGAGGGAAGGAGGPAVRVDADGAPQIECPEPLATELRAAARLAHRAGIPLGDVLDALGVVERSRRSAERAREAALAGPRASARLLGWLPAAGLAFAAIVEPRVVPLVATTPLGWALIAVGLALSLAGRRWMAAALESAERAGGKGAPAPGPVALCALLGAGVRSGLDVRTALALVADAAGPQAAPLAAAAARLGSGAAWDDVWHGAPPGLAPVARALAPAWERGASPVGALGAAAAAMAEADATRAEVAAAELGVRLSLPLALCLLPAFVMVGVAPLVLAVGGAVIGDLGGALPAGPP